MLNGDVVFAVVAIAVFLVELFGIIAAIHAIIHTRTAQGAIAWGIFLVLLPWLALILYGIFGRNKFKGYVSLRSLKNKSIRPVIDACIDEGVEKKLFREELTTFDRVLTRLASLPITRFNKCQLLVDGDTTFRSIFNGIASAKEYILVQFYIIKNDQLGRELKTRLIQKAKDRVKVYFLYDEIGSFQLPSSYIQEMKDEGIEIFAFHTTKGKANHFQFNFRNHRKIVVVDGKIAYGGGCNVGDEYVSKHPKFGSWRDTHVQIEGPAVKQIQYCFIQDWYWATTRIPELNWKLEKAKNGREETLIIASGPADNLETCSLMFIHAIHMARERFWIASPYFIPDMQILSALKLAVLKGVDVRILMPEKPDHRTIHLASFSFYENTIPFGIKLYRYTEGFMHQKVFLVDSVCAAVGTANLDNRSFRLNFEFTILNFDSSFIQQVENLLHEDFSRSRLVALAEFTQRSFFFKLAARSAKLLAPVL
ncbi:MAG: cardiolipin synthase [Thermodesulfobacteriota bacterium]|nr:cardiolipin synthase [Thermodesulfobacteriota bacterium]